MKPTARSLVSAVLAAMWCSYALASGEQRVEAIQVIGSAVSMVGVADSATEGTITAEQLENRPKLRVGEVLEVVPGLIVTQHSGFGKANQLFLRGFNLDHGTDFRTTVNGMPINLPTHAHGQGYTDINFLIPELIDRVTYKKGPYHAEEGDFSAAGAVNIGLMRKLKQGIASIELGEHRYQRVLAANSSALGGGDVLYGLELHRQDGPWENPEDVRKASGALSYTWGPSDNRFNVTALGYTNRWNATDQVPLRALDSGEIGRFGTVDPSDGGKTHRYSLSGDWHHRGEASATDVSAYFIDYKLNLFSNFTYFLNNPAQGDQFEQSDRRRIYGVNAEHKRFANLDGRDMTHVFGAQVRYDDIDNVGLHLTQARERLVTVRDDRVKQSSVSLYYDNRLQWSPTFRTLAGVRADFHRFDVKSDLAENSGNVNDHIVSPKLGAVFGPFGKTEFYANAGYGFHSNDARGATINFDPSTGDPADKVKPLVRAKGAELGVRTEFVKGLQTSLALWHLDIDSELVFAGDAGTTEANRPSRRRGIEFANYWRPMKGVIVDADIAISRARFRDDAPQGNRIPGAIERTASAGVTFDNEKWFAGFRGRYFGGRPLTEDDTVRSKSSTLFNLKLGYKPTKDVKLSLDVLNLFDKKVSDIDYYYESRLRNEAAPVADIHTHPAEPRTIRASATFKF